jgi:hypothetical protein
MTKASKLNWHIPVPPELQAGAICDRWTEVRSNLPILPFTHAISQAYNLAIAFGKRTINPLYFTNLPNLARKFNSGFLSP